MAKFDHGVTRNPYHPLGKAVFAINMDKLRIKLDGKFIPIENVQGAFPDVNTLVVFVRNEEGEAKLDEDGAPELEYLEGRVEIVGKPTSCGCSMGKFRVANWWDKKLNG